MEWEKGFSGAGAENLPQVDSQLKENIKAAPAKTRRSNQDNKFREAIGRCRLIRRAGRSMNKANFTPKLDVKSKPHTVSCLRDEGKRTAVESSCDCLPISSVKVSEESAKAFFDETVKILKENNSQCLLARTLNLPGTISSIWHLLVNYTYTVPKYHNGLVFIEYCKSNISKERCQAFAEMTKNKAENFLYVEEKYARITASRLFDASRSYTCPNSTKALVNTILGDQNPKDFDVKDSRIKLKPAVASVIKKTYATKFKRCGWIIKSSYPIFMASPDGFLKDFVVEIKCPSSKKSFNEYFSADLTEPASKYKAEVMLQMFLSEKNKCLFCVADPEFKANKIVKIVEVQFDKSFLRYLLLSAEQFWLASVYPRVYSYILKGKKPATE